MTTPRVRPDRALVAALAITLASACATINPLDDTRIEAEVKARLVAQRDANLTRLAVMSHGGTVHLSGDVESEEHKTRAETLAREVRGVKRVVNSLDVRPSPR